MNFINEKHVITLDVRDYCGQVACSFESRARRCAKLSSHLLRYDPGQRRLAKPRRSVEQNVIQRLAASLSCRDVNFQLVFEFFLTRELVEILRPHGDIVRRARSVEKSQWRVCDNIFVGHYL